MSATLTLALFQGCPSAVSYGHLFALDFLSDFESVLHRLGLQISPLRRRARIWRANSAAGLHRAEHATRILKAKGRNRGRVRFGHAGDCPTRLSEVLTIGT